MAEQLLRIKDISKRINRVLHEPSCASVPCSRHRKGPFLFPFTLLVVKGEVLQRRLC